MDFWDFFWVLAIWIPLILLWGFTLVDLFASRLSGITKGLWAIAIIFLPIIGVILYFALRPMDDPEYATGSGTQTGASDPSDIARLADLNERGLLDDADFARIVSGMYR
ncbi:MAG: PLD nuclease N-terminal domain-containing protein [Actinomycetota bacterium]